MPHVDKSSLAFKGVKLKAKADSEIKITNLGGGEMEGYVSCDVPWLAVLPNHIHPRLAEQAIRIEADTGYLRAGKAYSGTVTFKTSGGDLSVPVNLTVSEPWWKGTEKLERPVAMLLAAAFVISFAIVSLRSGSRLRPAVVTAPTTEVAGAATGDALPPDSDASSPGGEQQAVPPSERDENESVTGGSNATPDSKSPEVEASTSPEDSAQDDSATLSLSVNAQDAKVSLDGRPLGIIHQGRTQQVTVKPGQHVLQANKEGYVAWERVIDVKANARESIAIHLEAAERASQQGGPAQPDQYDQPSIGSQGNLAREYTPPVDQPAPRPAEAVNKPMPEPPPTRIQVTPMAVSSSVDGKFVIVVLAGRNSGLGSSAGSVEVAVDENSGLRRISGSLPGRPCGISLAPVENIDEISLRETPGPMNQWGRAAVRIRPKDFKRAVRFTINWQLR